MKTLWLKKAEKTAEKIESLRTSMQAKTDDELKDISIALKKRAVSGEKPEKLLVEAFAVAREAAKRAVGMEPFKVQLIGGIAIHEGKMTEMKTGEGKTLVAVLPAYLNALYGKGVHIVTVNDYLAKRDSEWMGKVYSFLGLSVGCVLQSDTTGQRKGAYAKDITYVTNTQLGFDYLRDNMAQSEGMVVQRGLNFAIIDEADSILIDEARTPLIISGNGEDVSKLCNACDILAKKMEKGTGEFDKLEAFLGDRKEETGDFIVYEKDKIIALTECGVKKIEDFFRIEHYGDDSNMQLHHAMDLALRANYIMERDKDYIVRDGEVLIVDEFTGRIMEGRQYSDGLHQAIEAKEHVKVRQVTQTVATTTYQCFFNKYMKKAGMTGTAYTEKKEFKRTYKMKTVVIPTNEPMIRVDKPDVVYMTHGGKYLGVIEEIKKTHATGQPILVGTASVEDSEELSAMLHKEGIAHQVLNAKQDKHEAEVIARAGIHGTVTIATNMAGRGTDIILDKESKEAGGLKVIGTERHESRRIDNQLRGRSGRQGDPGESIFYVSMEDRIVRLFAPKRMLDTIQKLDTSNDKPLEGDTLGRTIRRAQKTVEEDYYGVRKNLLDYDKVNDSQREMIYKERRSLLAGEDCSNDMKSIIDVFLKRTLKKSADVDELIERIKDVIPITDEQENRIRTSSNKYNALKEVASEQYESRKEKVNDMFKLLEQLSLLHAIDTGWMEQLTALDYLKQDVSYEGFAQNDPKTVYANEAFELYDKMRDLIQKQAVYSLFHFTVVPRHTQTAVAS